MDNLFERLNKSKFRTSFKLKEKDIIYINKIGLEKIEEHAYDFINKRIKVKLENDGKQTPTKNHPVFIGQHATATCCRGCLYKWHNIPEYKILTDNEVKYVVNVIMEWIRRELKK